MTRTRSLITLGLLAAAGVGLCLAGPGRARHAVASRGKRALAAVQRRLAHADDAPPAARALPPPSGPRDRTILVPIFDAERGLGQGWYDFGWSPHDLGAGAPIAVDVSGFGGLVLAHPGLSGEYGGLAFRIRAPVTHGDFLEVRLDAGGGGDFPRVKVTRAPGWSPGGWTDLWIPIEELNPEGKFFDRVVFWAWRQVGRERVGLDRIGLTPAAARPRLPARPGRYTVDCAAPERPISPLIYGIAGFGDEQPFVWELGATARRWGGNPTSRYNWELGAWNQSHDWYWRNMKAPPFEAFLAQNREHGIRSTVVVPMLGWVAKDTTSYSFPVSVDGRQQSVAWDLPDAGNGVSPEGKPLPVPAPTRTSVRQAADGVERWVRHIRELDPGPRRTVHAYILDNEPMGWHLQHRDVHPEPATYDELLAKTIAYATAVRRADPQALIAGPAEWGYLAYHFSAKDIEAGLALRPDRLEHGNVPLIPWYLRKLREREVQTGVKLLDLLDVHFYPQAPNVGNGAQGRTDAATSALRLRQTRGLWDPTYTDESWIGERMRVLPLLREWIDENAPGLGISIGEWSFGAEGHMSGGLATAEVLGRFGLAGVTSAYYWTYPRAKTPAYWAFRAYRNYDGRGARFQDRSVPVRGEARLASLFASRGEGQVVAILLNLDPSAPLTAELDLAACGKVSAVRAFTYTGGDAGFGALPGQARGDGWSATVEPYSITVVEATVGP